MRSFNAVIAGGSGNIGKSLVKHLVKLPACKRIVSVDTNKAPEFEEHKKLVQHEVSDFAKDISKQLKPLVDKSIPRTDISSTVAFSAFGGPNSDLDEATLDMIASFSRGCFATGIPRLTTRTVENTEKSVFSESHAFGIKNFAKQEYIIKQCGVSHITFFSTDQLVFSDTFVHTYVRWRNTFFGDSGVITVDELTKAMIADILVKPTIYYEKVVDYYDTYDIQDFAAEYTKKYSSL